MRRLCALIATTAVLVTGCKSDSETLLDLRTDLRTKLDELYSAYGGSALATRIQADVEKTQEADDGGATAARVVGELDRSYFEAFCLARGRGERPFSLSGKLDAFMREPRNEKACRDAAKLQARIAELEARAGR